MLRTSRSQVVAISEQTDVQAVRLGSILKIRARHSATQDSCFSRHPIAPPQLSQLSAVCAATIAGQKDAVRTSNKPDSFMFAAFDPGASTRMPEVINGIYGRT